MKESMEVEFEHVKGGKYPWHLLRRTVLLLNAYLVCGLSIGVIGPTLLDLKDIVGSTVGELSFILMVNSIGSLVGCFSTGFLLDRFSKFRYLILGGTLVLLSVPLSVFPYCPSLIPLYVCSFLSGVGNGSLDSAVNVIVLRLWEDGDSGPYMHALHFTWGLGAFLAPLTAKPFLVHQAETGTGNESNYAFTENINGTDATNPFLTIKTLYPSLSSYGILTTIGCLFYFIKDVRVPNPVEDKAETQGAVIRGGGDISRRSKLLIIGLLSILFFLYNGMEVAFGTFISVFAVKSNLGLTRAQGSDVVAIFWGTFATMRGLSVVLAIFAKPATVMWCSISACFVGSVLLSVWAGDSSIALYTGASLLGLGMASIIATGFLWTEQRIRVTSKVSAVFVISALLGGKLFPVMVGNLVESWPIMLHYLCLAITCGCGIIFSAANIIYRSR